MRMATLFGTVSEFEAGKEQWTQYVERLGHFFAANGITNEEKKCSIFLSVVGPTLLLNLVAPQKPGEKMLAELVAAMKQHHSPTPSKIVQRYMFHTCSRKTGESVTTFVAELRDRLVCGINDEHKQRRLLSKRLTGAARKLVGHFKHSALAMSSLKEKQKALNVPEHTLIQDVVTRWNSTYFMLDRLLEERWAIYGVLHDETVSKSDHERLDLTNEQWELISQLMVVLKPLQVATTTLCEEHNVSVSLVYPVVSPVSDDQPAVKLFKETVSQELKWCFDPDSEGIAEDPPVLASAIDPRYHQLKIFRSEQRSVAYSKLKELAESTS